MATYRLGRREAGNEKQAWTFLGRETNPEILREVAHIDNAFHPALYEYIVIADGMEW